MKLSILNLAPLRKGQNYRQAIDSMVKLAQKAESLGIERYWIGEHHNMEHLASSANQLLIMHTLANTRKIRVGAGGVMLPNHSPYIVAEQYGTLATLYPDRIDLGLGRAPGTDMRTARALRRNVMERDFPMDIVELRSYFEGESSVRAHIAEKTGVPFYILGSSKESAYLAAQLGLPYSFAAHFAPRMMIEAVEIYCSEFKPSKYCDRFYVILCVNAIVAKCDKVAKQLATTQTRFFLNVMTNVQQTLQPPVKSNEDIWENHAEAKTTPHFGPLDFSGIPLLHQERFITEEMMACSLIGSPKSVRKQLQILKSAVHFDEIMAVTYIFDEEKQHRSYELLSEIVKTR